MPDSNRCVKCGTDRQIPDVRVIERGHSNLRNPLKAGVEKTPSAMLFKGLVEVELRATICGTCGYAELYAADPDALWTAHQSATTG